jgi:beta-glucosidase
MTLDEKLQQVQLLSDGQITDADAQSGVGAVFSLVDPAKINHFQHIAVEQSRLHIPILFAYDTIHGYRTIFPGPAGRREQLRPVGGHRRRHRRRARDATVGIKQIYSPMVDVSHEPRWGRISEAAGEDPVPRLRLRGRARQGRAGRRLLGARQGRHERQALRRLRPARGRP